MRPRTLLGTLAALALVAWAPSAAQADFGFLPGTEGANVFPAAEGGQTAATLAGSHPYSISTEVNLKLAGEIPGRPGVPASDGDIRDLQIEEPPGLIENPQAIPRCALAQFHAPRVSPFESSLSGESCPDASQVGVVSIHSSYGGATTRSFGVFNLAPPPGAPSQFGFAPFGVPITFTPHVRQAGGEYGLTLSARAISQLIDVYGIKLTIWGTPWAASHDTRRGSCLNEAEPSFGWAKCRVRSEEHSAEAYLTLPTSCEGALPFTIAADSWQDPGARLANGEADLSDGAWRKAAVEAQGLEGCGGLSFNPTARTTPTTDRASTPSGLDFSLEPGSEGLLEPGGRAPSQIRKAEVALPAGVSVNPSVGSGLGTCSEAGYAAETLTSAPGAACPNASKIGEFNLQSPLLEGTLQGSLFLATPYENPFGTLLALYMVAKSPERGILVKVAGEVRADPTTGQLTASFDRLPQLPYSHLQVFFREGQRSPLANPANCGTYASQISLSPWLDPNTTASASSFFQIAHGIAGAPCPPAVPPFAPQAVAGTLNQNAGSYTPFDLHLTRTDAEQEITSYSTVLPPGLLGKIAGIPYCPEADIEAAKRSSGAAETEHPSCPEASLIGHTISGFGLGSVLAYAPGGLYLAGPFHGSSFSVVAIDAATVGPFDLGTIVIRSAIKVNPRTAQVSIDSAGSDPIPHIRDGIPLHLRDIRVHIDRPNTTINPTSCAPFSVASSLTASHAPFTNPQDASAAPSAPFQASNCSSLRFAPKLRFQLRGGTHRGAFPALEATLTPPQSQEAGIAGAVVTLPAFEFLAQSHIKTICTNPQFQRGACPADSIYGHARATSPLLGEALQGPVYLRSSPNLLPDMVAQLRGAGTGIEIEVVGRIDSSRRGGLRATFEDLPDAPVTKFTMSLAGGKKGLLANEQNVCSATETATARFSAQDGAGWVSHPRLEDAACSKRGSKARGGRGR